MTDSEKIKYLTEIIVKSTLLPCPLCGGKDLDLGFIADKTCTFEPEDKLEVVKCYTCGCSVQRRTGVGVVSAWNTRVIK